MNPLYNLSIVSLGMMLRNHNFTYLPADSYKHFSRNFFLFFNLQLSCFTKFVVSAINFAVFLAQFCHSFFKHFIGASFIFFAIFY